MINDQALLTAATTGSNTYELGGTNRDLSVYIAATGTVSAGKLQMETAHDPSYTGTWAPLGAEVALTTLTGSLSSISHYSGPHRVIRARMTQDITGGGSVSVYIVAN